MSLELTDRPGLWVDEDAGGAGVHALVVGVSAYPHLDGGAGPPAQQTFGLGQLTVSALTAYRVFDWLRSRYRHRDKGVRTVQLMLSPTAAELAAEPAMRGSFGDADYDSLETALGEWRQRLASLAPAAAESSRAVFFFSGHGLEVSQQKQILLPSDYLRPDKPSINRAVSTSNVKLGLLPLRVPDQMFFVDACRNGSELLGAVAVDGAQIFNVLDPHHNNPDVNSAIMYGTASGAQSWSPDDVSGELSLFGRALLEAVSGRADVDVDAVPPTIWFDEVAKYANGAIRRELRRQGSPARQAIRGDLAFIDVVHDLSGGASPPAPAEPQPAGAPDGGLVPAGVVVGDSPTAAFEELLGRSDPDAGDDDGWESFPADADPHAWFGRESLTALWGEETRAQGLLDDEPVDLEVLGVERFEVRQHRVRFAHRHPRPVWLRVAGTNAEYGVVLPGGRDVEFELAMGWDDTALVQVDVDLALSSPPPLDETARLWLLSREESAATAARRIERFDLELATGVVQAKVASRLSPLGAVVASLVLLRAGTGVRRAGEPVPEPWARNMATLPQFDALPDGAAIWAEVLTRLGERAPRGLGEALEQLGARELTPITLDGFGYALAAAEVAVHTSSTAGASGASSVHEWLSAVAPFLHSGGLFLVLVSSDGALRRDLVLRPG